MKFDISQIPEDCLSKAVQVGNIYPAKGGRGDTSAWVVVAASNTTAHMLGLDINGAVVSTASYGLHAIEGREIIGFCKDVQTMNLIIERRSK